MNNLQQTDEQMMRDKSNGYATWLLWANVKESIEDFNGMTPALKKAALSELIEIRDMINKTIRENK